MSRIPDPPKPPPLRYERSDGLPLGFRLLGAVLKGVLIAFVIIAAITVIAVSLPQRDDSDTADVRSGMSIHRDALTGCEYFSRGFFGGLTPRMNREGKQVCR
jgi:hypothetical protein